MENALAVHILTYLRAGHHVFLPREVGPVRIEPSREDGDYDGVVCGQLMVAVESFGRSSRPYVTKNKGVSRQISRHTGEQGHKTGNKKAH